MKTPRSSKVKKVLSILEKHPEYKASDVVKEMKGAIRPQYVYAIIAKYKTKRVEQVEDTKNVVINTDSLILAIKFLISCNYDFVDATSHLKLASELCTLKMES